MRKSRTAASKKPRAKKKSPPSLSPSQREARDALVAATAFGQIFVVWGAAGMGKTTILRELCETHFPRARFLSTADFLREMTDRDPFALEETYAQMLRAVLAKADEVIVDDLHVFHDTICCHQFYPRMGYVNGPLSVVVGEAIESGKKLIVAAEQYAPVPFHNRAYYFGVKQLIAADYAHLAGAYLPAEVSAKIDFTKLHRFAPKLNGHQLRGAAEELAADPELDTQRFIEYLRSRRMSSNVDLAEVQQVDLHSLKGLDDVIESLEANVVLPFEDDKLATELEIKPKRGVLLIGPPGTGKTTVGRALAHRLKSKFFLIDGTIISGTDNFYEQIQRVSQAAKQNAPSIIFIDDSDVIFEEGREQGLYRYLLTMLDGIESEAAGRISVMMTAMDVGSLPPALIRSGRIELWLETRLPDESARTEILRELLANLPEQIPQPDIPAVAAATEGLTGADIKRLVDDAKILFAFDKSRSRPLRSTTDYLLAAIDTVRANKQRYAEAETRVRAAAAKRRGFE